mgnify:CR=1 FL=1
MTRPRGKMKGESDLSYAIAMLNFHKHPMNRRMAGDNSRVKAAEKRVLDLGGKEALYGIQAREQARKQAIRNKRSQLAPRKGLNKPIIDIMGQQAEGPVQRPPRRPSTLTPIQLEQQKRFKKELQKQRDMFNKNIARRVTEANKKLKPPKTPTDTQIKQNKHNRKMAKLAGIDTSSAIAQSRKKVKRQPSVTSQYRGGSGKKKYNQAAYFAGLGVNPNTKKNQGIYKPYANGGGVRKPKYKE